ncbi:hypothetical protein CBW24_12900 [Pacificitalea manganoxidans]|uniref:Lipoprotein n=1 Tax=Pacificitalea manganoxidans TaxID=1411902 RepID=A0A291M1N3_9RHOB|nr:hypothetical protein [Pacificitalea manganoxidans]MAQ46783.1 hypothetical protein [Actibacterium sp.]OWU68814.1 hypothetical protein ATO2_10185 [Roseovarius sp. 22II1-1F6A]ATI42810.1 hypothetical protein CBW24_12900 [Pacificitalea manganoxidans]MBF54424.1 hypothetical protein [Actibacterium sp.]MDR6307285.1 hypothetical protein [Pacificitalea manganoxidans]|tara:strand:- start:82 stop:378 length:297 start_codon:yes stop_codon:yes gene_type:complete
MLKSFHAATIACLTLPVLSGCMGTAGGAMGQAVVSNAVAGQMNASANRNRFATLSCDQLAQEIASARTGFINPMNAPATQAYINAARDAARAKNCPGI